MSYATRWAPIRSTSAASISAPPAGRYTHRPTPATAGRRLSAIFRPCYPWRCRRLRDSASKGEDVDELDRIPWKDLTHAYGSAEDVPDLLRALRTCPPDLRGEESP